MKLWKFILVCSVCTLAFLLPVLLDPDEPNARVAPLISSPGAAPRHLQVAQLNLAPSIPPMGLSRSPVNATAVASSLATPAIDPAALKPLKGIRICIDPGHGGQATLDKLFYCGGTRGAATHQTESDVNLKVALFLFQYLTQAGAEVILTRTTDNRCTRDGDKHAELMFRPNLANAIKADLFISIHHNESTRPSTNYSVAFYPVGIPVSSALAENISSACSRYMGTPDMGGKPGDYTVLNNIRMPGVLVEASFMSNPDEDARLSLLGYTKMEAKAIATGVLNYYRVTKNQPVDFNTIFAPIDNQAHTAQTLADAAIKRGTSGAGTAYPSTSVVAQHPEGRPLFGGPAPAIIVARERARAGEPVPVNDTPPPPSPNTEVGLKTSPRVSMSRSTNGKPHEPARTSNREDRLS